MTRPLVVLTVLLAASSAAAGDVIWADPNTNQILRGAADGNGSAVELFGPADYPGSPGSLLPFGVAVAGGFVYWSDTGTDQILRGAADGSGSAVELLGPADYPGSPGSLLPFGVAVASLVETAEKVGVVLCLENVWNGMFYSPIELIEFVDSFGSDRLGVYFDVGNCLGYQQHPPHWIELLGNRIKRVHIKDYKENFDWQGSYHFPNLGEGDVPWDGVASSETIKKTGVFNDFKIVWRDFRRIFKFDFSRVLSNSVENTLFSRFELTCC